MQNQSGTHAKPKSGSKRTKQGQRATQWAMKWRDPFARAKAAAPPRPDEIYRGQMDPIGTPRLKFAPVEARLIKRREWSANELFADTAFGTRGLGAQGNAIHQFNQRIRTKGIRAYAVRFVKLRVYVVSIPQPVQKKKFTPPSLAAFKPLF